MYGYQLQNQPHYNVYEQCSSYHGKHPNELPGAPLVDYGAPQDLGSVASYPVTEVTPTVKQKQQKDGKKPGGRLVVDTSAFSVEERLIAAVWVHERKRTKSSMSQIKNDFRQRFGRDPPAKNTLLVWERKLFSTGSVHDAPRPGRPVNRRSKVEEVSASLRAAPTLSLRARAAALRVPRTTLRTILQRDLRHTPANSKKQTPTKNSKKLKAKVKPQTAPRPNGCPPERPARQLGPPLQPYCGGDPPTYMHQVYS